MAENQRREGREEGKLELRRQDIIDLMTKRFGAPSKEIVKKVKAEMDLAALDQWFEDAMTASTIQQVGIA